MTEKRHRRKYADRAGSAAGHNRHNINPTPSPLFEGYGFKVRGNTTGLLVQEGLQYGKSRMELLRDRLDALVYGNEGGRSSDDHI